MVRKIKLTEEISASQHSSFDAGKKRAPVGATVVGNEWKIDSETPPENLSRIQEMNRKLILDAALDVFSTYGFRGSTIDQISQKAGMSKPNLLYYFRRKEDIYVTVLQQTMEQWLVTIEAINPEGDPLEELSSYIRSKVELSFRYPAASRLFASEILQGAPAIGDFLRENMRKLVDEKAAMIGRWMDEGKLAKSDPYHLIFSIWATTQHYSDYETQLRAVLGPRFDAPDMCENTVKSVCSILLDGIRPR